MTYLLDTHTFLWSTFSQHRLSSRSHAAITDPGNDVLVSTVTFWELALKYGLGKIKLKGTTPEELPAAATSMGFGVLPLNASEACSFHRLPRDKHRDPFDRMLVWQAISERIPLITKDPELAVYSHEGLIVFW